MKSSGVRPSEILRRLPLFIDLTDQELGTIAEGVSRREFDSGAVVFSEGDWCRELLIVEEGEVRLYKSALNGRQQLLSIERKGSALAEVAAFDEGRYPATAEAMSSPTVVLRLPAESFRNACVSNPQTAAKMFKALARRQRHLVRLVEELSFNTVRTRLIAYLVGEAEERGQVTATGNCFALRENNEELAARLGTVRELVSRNLGRLHSEKLIVMKRRAVEIPDLTALRKEIK